MAELSFLNKAAGKLFDKTILSQANDMANELVTKYSGRIEQEAIARYSNMLQEQTNYSLLYGNSRYGRYMGTYNPDDITLTTYDRMRFDPQLHAGLQAIKLPILQLTWDVESPNTEVREFVKKTIAPLWKGLIRSTLTALDFGYSGHEKVWQIENKEVAEPTMGGKIDSPALTYRKIKSLHPCTLTLNIDPKGNFKGMTQYPYRAGFDGHGQDYGRVYSHRNTRPVVIPLEKTYLFTHAFEFGNWYGHSRLKPAYATWFEYWVVSGLLERYLERYGAPTKIATAPTGASQTGVNSDGTPKFEDNMTLAERAAQSVGPDAVITFPAVEKDRPGWGLEYMSAEDSHEQFLNTLKYLDNIKLRALFVPERILTQEFATGSGKMVEQQVWIFLNAIKALTQEIEEAINRFVVDDLVHFNFGKNAPPVRLVIESISKEREEFLADIYKGMLIRGFVTPDPHKIEAALRIPFSEKIPVPISPQGLPLPIEEDVSRPAPSSTLSLGEFEEDPYWKMCSHERIIGRMGQAKEILSD